VARYAGELRVFAIEPEAGRLVPGDGEGRRPESGFVMTAVAVHYGAGEGGRSAVGIRVACGARREGRVLPLPAGAVMTSGAGNARVPAVEGEARSVVIEGPPVDHRESGSDVALPAWTREAAAVRVGVTALAVSVRDRLEHGD
jgi:hypothetical protein